MTRTEMRVERMLRFGNDLGCSVVHSEMRPNRVESTLGDDGPALTAYLEDSGEWMVRDIDGRSFLRLLGSSDLLAAVRGPVLDQDLYEVEQDLVEFRVLLVQGDRTVWARVTGTDSVLP